MRINKLVKKVIILYKILFLVSCIYSPWEQELYVEKSIDGVSTIDSIPSYKKYKNFYVNDVFVSMGIQPKNWGIYIGKSPYIIVLSGSGNYDIHKTLVVEEIEISSSLNKNYTLEEEIQLPLVLDFKPVKYTNQRTDKNFAYVNYTFSKKFEFNFKENEEILIRLLLNVDSTTSQWIEYHFIPKKRKGMIKVISI